MNGHQILTGRHRLAHKWKTVSLLLRNEDFFYKPEAAVSFMIAIISKVCIQCKAVVSQEKLDLMEHVGLMKYPDLVVQPCRARQVGSRRRCHRTDLVDHYGQYLVHGCSRETTCPRRPDRICSQHRYHRYYWSRHLSRCRRDQSHSSQQEFHSKLASNLLASSENGRACSNNK